MAATKIRTAPPAPARRVCVGCDMLSEPARPDAPLCVHCAPDPANARARIARRARAAEAILDAAQRRLFATIAALSVEDRERWHRFDHARRLVADGMADEVTRKRVSVTTDALKSNSPRMGPALCLVWAADEAWWWARQEHAAHARRAQKQTDVLDAWLKTQTSEVAS